MLFSRSVINACGNCRPHLGGQRWPAWGNPLPASGCVRHTAATVWPLVLIRTSWRCAGRLVQHHKIDNCRVLTSRMTQRLGRQWLKLLGLSGMVAQCAAAVCNTEPALMAEKLLPAGLLVQAFDSTFTITQPSAHFLFFRKNVQHGQAGEVSRFSSVNCRHQMSYWDSRR